MSSEEPVIELEFEGKVKAVGQGGMLQEVGHRTCQGHVSLKNGKKVTVYSIVTAR